MARLTHYPDHSLGSIALVLFPRALLKLPPSQPPSELSLKNTWHCLAGLLIHVGGPTWVSRALRVRSQGPYEGKLRGPQSCLLC